MGLTEIIVLLISLAIVVGVIGNYIYRKYKKLPTGECAYCSHTKAGNKLVSEYHKKYNK